MIVQALKQNEWKPAPRAACEATHHQHSKVTMVAAMDGGSVAPRARYVAALCPPATVSIQQVKIPVGCGGVDTRR